MEPSSFLIKNDGRQITKDAIKSMSKKNVLIPKSINSNEKMVMKIVYNKTTSVALRWDKPKRNRWWWMWFLSAEKGLLFLKILTKKTLKVSTNGYENNDISTTSLLPPIISNSGES